MTNHAFKAGESRHQACLLPPGIEDYVGPDNPVRAIESFVCALDLAKFGFRHAERGSEEVGQPPYDPADLLKLYLYDYINQVRSSRRLGREAWRNLELIWLLKNLWPGYRTIANFRKENWTALKAEALLSCKRLINAVIDVLQRALKPFWMQIVPQLSARPA
jgi:transposase